MTKNHFCSCFLGRWLVRGFWLLLGEGGREAVFWGAVMNGADAIFNFPHLVCQTRLPSLPRSLALPPSLALPSQLRRRRHKILSFKDQGTGLEISVVELSYLQYNAPTGSIFCVDLSKNSPTLKILVTQNKISMWRAAYTPFYASSYLHNKVFFVVQPAEMVSSSSGVFNIHGFGSVAPSHLLSSPLLLPSPTIFSWRGSFQLSNKYEPEGGRERDREDDDPANNEWMDGRRDGGHFRPDSCLQGTPLFNILLILGTYSLKILYFF